MAEDWDLSELEGRPTWQQWMFDRRSAPGDVGRLARWLDGHPCCMAAAEVSWRRLLEHVPEHPEDRRWLVDAAALVIRGWQDETRGR